MPRRKEGEQFAIATQLLGVNQIKAIAEDGKERNCRIPGKMKKKVWIREGDLILIKVWDFQPSKADIAWRYLGFQREYIQKKGLLKNLPL